jgi:hypothetical protein
LAKITVWAFLAKFGKKSIFNDTQLIIWVKFNADSEFYVKTEFLNHFRQKNKIFGHFMGIL